MAVNLRKIEGNWDAGYALDKHMLHSEFTGYNEAGHPTFENTRTQVGEAVYRLKYRQDWSQAPRLASAVVRHVVPLLGRIGLVVPMPASRPRTRQPVNEVAGEVGKLLEVKMFAGILVKNDVPHADRSLKDVSGKAAKEALLAGRFSIEDQISNHGRWNVLLIDDLYDTGASMEAACACLKSYAKIDRVFVVALTWK